MLCAEKGRPGEAYFITDGEPVVFREFVTAMLAPRASSRPTQPAGLDRGAAGRGSASWPGSLPLPGEPPMTQFRSWLLTQECTIEIAKAREELGYGPRPHEQGLGDEGRHPSS